MSEKIPKGWKWVKLGEVVRNVSETYSFDDDNDEVVFLNTSDIYAGKVINHKKFRVKDLPGQAKKKILKNDLLFSEIRPANKRYALIDFEPNNYVVSTKLMVLRCTNKIDSVFFKLFITSEEQLNYLQMIAEDRSGTFPQITFKQLADIDILLPPLPEQKAIADVLSSLDDKIDLLHRQNKTLEEMAMTLFRQWFIDPTKDGLPDGWEEVSLGEIIEISSGKSIEKGKLKEKGLYPVLGANGEIGRTDDWLYEGELIYTGRVGTLGNVFIVFKNEKVWLTDNTLVIKPKKNEYFYFVYFTLKNAKLDEYNSGSTQPLIRQSDIKKIEIFLPKINFLKDFEVISRNLFTKIQFNTSQIQTLEKLRDTLLPKLMSGEVRVKVENNEIKG